MTETDNEELLAARMSVPLGRYRHYKGPTYAVIGYVFMAETEEWGVLYTPEDKRAKLVAQSVRRFNETVSVNVSTQPDGNLQSITPRFKLID